MAACYVPGAVPTWQNAAKTCHVFRATIAGRMAICFEGTTDTAEWLEDFNPVEVPYIEPAIGPVHKPSLDNVRGVLPEITDYLDIMGKPPVLILGHSKGAREGPICHALLKGLGYHVVGGYYFEAPRTGGTALRNYLAREPVTLTQTWNIHGSDIVTLLPDCFDLWVDVRPPIRLRVPDDLGIRDKHVMTGVLAGLQGAP